MKRNGKIDFWRFVFALIVVLHHSQEFKGQLPHALAGNGHLAVEFFFLVSGYLLMASIAKKKEKAVDLGKETVSFLHKKIKGLLPNFYLAFLVALTVALVRWQLTGYSGKEILERAAQTVWEVLFVHMTGLGSVRVNGVDWYLSVMLLSLAVLYPLARKYPSFFPRVAAPVFALLVLGFLYRKTGNLTQATGNSGILEFYRGFLRGLAEISLGCACYPPVQKWREMKPTFVGKLFVSLVETFCYGVAVYVMLFRHEKVFDFYVLLLLSIAVCLSFTQQGYLADYFDRKLFVLLGGFSLDLYLNHGYWAALLHDLKLDYSTALLYYVFLAFVTAGALHFLSRELRKRGILRKIVQRWMAKQDSRKVREDGGKKPETMGH